jgi:hypothetical protein
LSRAVLIVRGYEFEKQIRRRPWVVAGRGHATSRLLIPGRVLRLLGSPYNRALHKFVFLRFGELDDDLDIVIPPLEGACEVLRPLSSGDQPVQP